MLAIAGGGCMMREKNNKNRIKPRDIRLRTGARMTAFFLTLAMLVTGGAVFPFKLSAAETSSDAAAYDNTYALQVSTGVVSTTGKLADEILYFKIVYVDTDNYVRSHRIFPGENALEESFDRASEIAANKKTSGNETSVSATTIGSIASKRKSIYSQLGASMAEDNEAFQAYSTDTFFFTPLKKVKSIQSIEILMCDKKEDSETYSMNGSWSCQGLRVYKVSEIYGVGMYGYVSGKRFVAFSGKLIAAMEGARTFNWDADRVFRIMSDNKHDGRLVQKDEDYSTNYSDRYIRIDIADTYGAGIGTMGNNTKKQLFTSDFDESAALIIRYKDIYGATREASLPLMTTVIALAIENGVSINEMVSGLAQDGEILAVAATLPDAQTVDSIRIIYGTLAAEQAIGLKVNTDKVQVDGNQDRTVVPADEAGADADLFSIIGVSVYNSETNDIALVVMDTMLRFAISGSPESYYRAPSVSGNAIRPIKPGNSGVEITLQKYENGAKLLPSESSERYLVILYTDDSELAGTTGELTLTLNYTDLSGKELTSDIIDVSEAVTTYYGYWPGVSSGFSYRIGAKMSGTLSFVVSIKDVDKFTGAQFLLRGNDDWQMKCMEIYQLEGIGGRVGEWSNLTDGTEKTDRSYTRSYQGKKLLGLNEKMLVEGGQTPVNTTFKSDSTAVIETDTGDWSEYRYSMSYETAQTLAKFAKSRCNYTVAVEIGDDQVTSESDGDCGSKNQFFFQLVFEDGKSAYVLVNQQLAADGFRTGYTETFTISTNRDMGELTAVKILPEDSSESSDIFDKLNIKSICVKKQTNEAVSRQWIINNVGWIDINYQDEAVSSSSDGYSGRTEAEVVNTYQVETSTYAVNLEFAITTGAYNTAKDTGETESQFVGQVYALVEYYDSNGVLKTSTYNIVEAMYDYAGQEKKVGTAGTVGQNAWPGGTESDPSFMFRAGKTDRFMLAIEDINQLVRVTLEVRSRVQTTWNIDCMYVTYGRNNGKRIINIDNEYQWVYDDSEKIEQLCYSTSSGSKAYTVALPVNQVQSVSIEFSNNQVKWSESVNNIVTSVTSRQPRSVDDSLNIYIYTTEPSGENALSNVSMTAGVQYSRVYGGISRTESDLKRGESNGRVMFYTNGVSVSCINTLSKLNALAYFNDEYSTGQVLLDYAVIQQVRSGVIIDTFYVDFAGGDAAADSKGISSSPTDSASKKSSFEQTVTISFGEGTSNIKLTPETDDVAISILYTTTNDLSEKVYESSTIFLTDQNITQIGAGKVVTLTFGESYIKEITGIRIRGTGASTRSGVEVTAAVIDSYEISASGGNKSQTGSFSFANGVKLTKGQSNRIMSRTDTASESGTVTELTIGFSLPQSASICKSAGMTLSYRNVDGVIKQLTLYNVCDYASGEVSCFTPGSVFTVTILISGVDEIRWISLSPTDEAENEMKLPIDEIKVSLVQNGTEKSYTSVLDDYTGKGVISLFNSVKVSLGATTTRPSTGTEETIDVGSGETKRLLVESGQTVAILPAVTGSSEGYSYRVEKFKDNFTSNAPETVTVDEGKLKFCAVNEYTTGSGSEAYYRLTVYSSEVDTAVAVIEFVVEPKYASSAQGE